IKTQFINPYQTSLDFLQELFSFSTLNANTIYDRLGKIEAGTLDPATDPEISAALAGYNKKNSTSVSAADLKNWVAAHLKELREVITLYEPDSKCDLATTSLRT